MRAAARPAAAGGAGCLVGLLLLPALLGGAAAAPPGAQPLPAERRLPLALAKEAAEAALDACGRQGHGVSVAVVDRHGLLVVQLRGDGAAPHTLDSSRRKAYTAASFRDATSRLDALIRSRPDASGLRDIPGFLALGGGLPIRAGTDVIGGIGVGGAPSGELDEACARAGLDRIAGRLGD